MKKILLSLLLIVTMIFSLTSCDKIFESIAEKNPELAFAIINALALMTGQHEWGMWQTVSPNNCEDITLTRFCLECDATQVMKSKREHKLAKHYSFDKDYHWYDCLACDHPNQKEKHTYDNDVCTTCRYTETPTEGIYYELKKTHASMRGYGGSDPFVVIPSEYKGVPVTHIMNMGLGTWVEVVVIPDSVTTIGNYAFYDCENLTRVVIPDSVSSIGTHAFYDCDSLENISIGDGVTTIDDGAFYHCSNLTSVVIGDSVTSIGYRAFAFNQNLTRVVLPKSLTNIEDEAFWDCKNLTDIYYAGTKEEWGQIDKGFYWLNTNGVNIHFNYVRGK